MTCKTLIMQGDAYPFGIILKANGEILDINKISIAQFMIGSLIKLYNSNGEGEVTYDDKTQMFVFPITQEESFALSGKPEVQVRVKFADGKVIGKKYGSLEIQFSNTKEVI